MDMTRALLDELMGKERDVPLEKRSNRERRFDDDDVGVPHVPQPHPPCLFSRSPTARRPSLTVLLVAPRCCGWIQVCKHDLCGLCPYSLFKNTRSDLGEPSLFRPTLRCPCEPPSQVCAVLILC